MPCPDEEDPLDALEREAEEEFQRLKAQKAAEKAAARAAAAAVAAAAEAEAGAGAGQASAVASGNAAVSASLLASPSAGHSGPAAAAALAAHALSAQTPQGAGAGAGSSEGDMIPRRNVGHARQSSALAELPGAIVIAERAADESRASEASPSDPSSFQMSDAQELRTMDAEASDLATSQSDWAGAGSEAPSSLPPIRDPS